MLEIVNPKTGEKFEVSDYDFTGTKDKPIGGEMDWNAANAACSNLGDGWRLPSFEELELIYNQLHLKGIGNFKSQEFDFYWSNNEYEGYDDLEKLALHFSFKTGGSIYPAGKWNGYYVCAIRKI